MKKSLCLKLLCVFSFVFGLFSVTTGLSDYIIDKTTYDENGTLANQATNANDNGEKVTVTLKYQKIESKSAPDFAECFDDNNQSFGTKSKKINVGGSLNTKPTKYNRLKKFLTDHVKDNPFTGENLTAQTFRFFGKDGDSKYGKIEFELHVTKEIKHSQTSILGDAVTDWYSGEYYMLARDYTKTVYKTINLSNTSQLSMQKNTSIAYSYVRNNLNNPDSTKYEFCGLKEVSSDGSITDNYFDMSNPITSNITLCAVFQNKNESSLHLSEITTTINNAASKATIEFFKGAPSGRDISKDPGYNEKENIVYLGTSSLKTTVQAEATIKFCLNDGFQFSEYQRTEKISFDPENSEHDRLYTISLLNDLIINGELIIGGEYGIKDDSGELQGNINNRYVCFDLNGHKLIVNKGGKLTSYGFIKDSVGTGQIEVNGGRIYTLATVADYRGGGYTTSIIGDKVFPFNLFALPYLKCKIIFNYSSKNGWGELIAGAHITLGALNKLYKSITIDLNIFGPGSSTSNKYLFSCANGINDVSKVIMNTYDYSENKMLDSLEQTGLAKLNRFCFNQKMKVNAYSTDIYLGYIDISVTFGITYSVNTKDLVFPISSFFEICMFSSSLTIKQRMQFSCGSSLIFDQNSKLIFDYSGDYVGNLSLLDIPLYYWDNRTNKLIDNAISTSIVQKDNFYNVAAYWKYYSMPKMKVYGQILFRKGNPKNYQIAGTLDFNEKNVGTIDSNGNINIYNDNEYDNCFSMLKQNGVKITTYGLDFLNLGTNKEQHTAGYSRPLISNGISYVVDDTNNMAGVFDNKTGVFTDAASSKKYIVNNNVENVSFSISDAGSATIDECSYDEKTHIISSNGKQYVYASNLCAEYNASAGTADFFRLGIGSVAVKYNSKQNRWLRG